MEENILQPRPAFKLYTESAILIGTFLGGPLITGYLAAENFKQLGETNKIKTAWIIAIGASIIVFGGAFLIPNMEKVPNYIIPIIYTLIARMLIQTYQGVAIKNHIQIGGQTYSNWRAVWVGLVSLAIILVVITAIVILSNKEVLQ